MSYLEVINKLKELKSHDRFVDLEIAKLMGYTRNVTVIEGGKRTVWYAPSGEKARHVPAYTESVNEAIKLAHELVPDHVGGCSWENNMTVGTARINDGPYIQAASPAIALCMAALLQAAKANK